MEVLTVHPNLTESIYDILGPEDSFGVAQVYFTIVYNYIDHISQSAIRSCI